MKQLESGDTIKSTQLPGKPAWDCEDATLEELRLALNQFCSLYPQYRDRTIRVASECGYASTGLNTPICFVVSKEWNWVKLLSNDDERIDFNQVEVYQ